MPRHDRDFVAATGHYRRGLNTRECLPLDCRGGSAHAIVRFVLEISLDAKLVENSKQVTHGCELNFDFAILFSKFDFRAGV